MEVVAGDSGVETEFDIESNDSSMSGLSGGAGGGGGGGAGQAVPLQPLPEANEEVATNSPQPLSPAPMAGSSLPGSSPPPALPPLPAQTEDGYLGDCSSDGGNEKNFPLPPDWAAPRQSLPPSPSFQAPHSPPSDDLEPPAGLSFSALSQSPGEGLGYQVLPQSRAGQSHLRTKMRSNGFRSRYNKNVPDDWNRLKASIAERKLKVAASTNNTELLERILSGEQGQANVRSMDEHKRTALHFAAAKGYSEVVEILLRHGADPNQKDQLGNTALHLAACTNHVPVVTLLLRAGTDLTTLDNNGRTPLQLAQAKLKILQKKKGGEGGEEMVKVKAEVGAVLDMMREYLARVGDTGQQYHQLLSSFSQRLVLHSTTSGLTSDLGTLLDSLSALQITPS